MPNQLFADFTSHKQAAVREISSLINQFSTKSLVFIFFRTICHSLSIELPSMSMARVTIMVYLHVDKSTQCAVSVHASLWRHVSLTTLLYRFINMIYWPQR